ncbi:MAG: carboxy terminal-processing peptidase [Planctomycetota bacterium]
MRFRYGKMMMTCVAACTMIMTSAVVQPVWGQAATQEKDPNLVYELEKPTKNHRDVSVLVSAIMEQLHLSKLKLDDTISNRAFNLYLEGLDPTKSYFMKSDLDDFAVWRDSLDDRVKRGDFTVGLKIFERFLDRVDSRTELALEYIDTEHDYTIDEEMITDNDLVHYATSEEEIRDRWRKRIKYSLLVLRSAAKEEAEKAAKKAAKEKEKNGDTPADDEAEKPVVKKKKDSPEEQLRKRYRSFARRMHQMDTEDVVERYLTAITTSFDPHTSYMSKRTFDNFIIIMGLELEGIGATLQATDDGYTVVKNIVKGGAAARQGDLKVEDKIVAVGQGEEDGSNTDKELNARHGSDFVDVTGMKLDDVVAMIRGKAGSTVRLSVMSENDSGLHTVIIVREKIKLEDSAARGEIFENGVKPDGNPMKIGVIELPSFYANMERKVDGRSTTEDVRKILNDFNSKGVDGLVVDLRKNGGGSLQEAIDCTGLFIDRGPVVQVKNPLGAVEALNDDDRGMAWQKPMVVLTSKFSASASEILAGAVQDYGRGLVIGDTTTHGKGTVQSLRGLSDYIYRVQDAPNDHGALKITTAQFYRPNGDSTQKRGVLSDIVLPSITDKMDNISEADLDYPVEFDRVPSAEFKSLSMVDKEMIQDLEERSAQRLQASEEFQDEIRKIQKYVEQKQRNSVSLNEEKFLARRKELSAENKDEELLKDQIENDNKIEKNYYLDEVLKITSDYMDMIRKSQG